MTEQELSEIEARANAAFRAPWTYADFEVQCENADYDCPKCDGQEFFNVVRIESPEEYPDGQVVADVPGLKSFSEKNGEFIAHAREDVPALIAEVRRFRKWKIENQWKFFERDCGVERESGAEYRDGICGCFVPTGSGELRHADSCPDFTPDGELK